MGNEGQIAIDECGINFGCSELMNELPIKGSSRGNKFLGFSVVVGECLQMEVYLGRWSLSECRALCPLAGKARPGFVRIVQLGYLAVRTVTSNDDLACTVYSGNKTTILCGPMMAKGADTKIHMSSSDSDEEPGPCVRGWF
jgi:hypothetical protein